MSELTDADHAFLEMDERAASARSPVETIGFIVAGMHRSGTSAIVRVLNLLGVDLPKELHPAHPDNPLGYWEPLQVVEAHEEFLTAIGSSFDDVFTLSDEALRGEQARALEDRLVRILETEFAGSRQFVVKDPRLCRLVPIWIAALDRFGASPRFVLPVRNPLEVAASLKLRNEYSTTKSLVLWLRHVIEAERHTRGSRRSIITYDQLLRDWQGTVARMAQELGVVWPNGSHPAEAEIEQFLSPRRRHHSFELDELRARADVVDWVKTTYEIFVAAADGEPLEEDVLDTLRGELDRADRAFGPLLAELSLAQRSQEKTLSEQASKLAERAESLDDRTQALAAANADVERLTLELAQREEALTAGMAEATASRAVVEQLENETEGLRTELGRHQQELNAVTAEASAFRARLERLEPEAAERDRALEETRAEIDRMTTELAQREGAVGAAISEAEASRDAVEQVKLELSDREQALGEKRAEIEQLKERVRELAEEMAARLGQTHHALSEAADARVALATRGERLTTTLAALTESRRQRRHLAHELANRIAAMNTLTETVESLEHAAAAHGAETEALRQSILELERREEATGARLSDATAELARAQSELARAQSELATAQSELATAQSELARARSELDASSTEIDRLVRALAERETVLATRIEAARNDAETISTLEARVAELERRRINLRRRPSSAAVRGPWRKSSPRSRLRSLTQFVSWLLRPRSGGWECVRTYLALRRSGEFDAEAYFAHYHDVRDSGINPLMHYVEHGRREGRTPFGISTAEETTSGAVVTAPPSPPSVTPSPSVSVPQAVVGPAAKTRGVDFSDFVILLARQRSGTNPLRWLLTAHKDITCFSEVFSVLDRDSDDRDFEDRAYRDVNFLNFAAMKEPNWSQPGVADHRELFLNFLEYLRCFSDKRYAVLDIKYNTTHLLAEAWAHNLGSPLLFDLIADENMKVVNVTRKNHLRFLLSNQKALESGDWHVWERGAAYHDRPVRIECADLLEELRIRSEEDAVISRRFEGYAGYLAVEYTDLFGDDGTLSPAFRRSLTDFLEIPDEWEPNQADGSHRQIFRRQSSLPLADAIENYEEVAETLSGTEFEWFLSDEPQYRTS